MDIKETTASKESEDTSSECTVCLQPYSQPVKLPCHHTFCFLCAKGIVQQNNKCALCRQAIPRNYLNNPLFVGQQPNGSENTPHRWYYEGHNGWWQYDERTNSEIEIAYQNREQQCEVLIAGFIYVIDFQANTQLRKFNPGRHRRIKRDLETIHKKGVAGVILNSVSANCKASSCSDGNSSKTSTPAELSGNTKCISIIIPNNGISGIHVNLDKVVPVSANSETPSSSDNSSNRADLASSVGIQPGLATVSTAEIVSSADIEVSAEVVVPSANVEVLPVPATISTASCSSNVSSSHVAALKKLVKTVGDNSYSPRGKSRVSKRCLSLKRKRLNNLQSVDQTEIDNAFGAAIVSKLQQMSSEQKLYAEKIINDTLFNGLLEKLSENSYVAVSGLMSL